jgi:hypothetical protein
VCFSYRDGLRASYFTRWLIPAALEEWSQAGGLRNMDLYT